MKNKSQIEVDQNVIDFLGGLEIKGPEDLVNLRKVIQNSLKFRLYNNDTKEHADSIQWKRTASEIIEDGYVYAGKACSDMVLVFLALCKAAGVEGVLVKFKRLDNKGTHSIVEVKLRDGWYRIDPSMLDAEPVEGRLNDEQVWNKNWNGGWKVWKRGRDNWDLGLRGIGDEEKIFKEL